MIEKRSLGDWLLLGGLVAFWGSSFALTKIAVETITPIWVVVLRLSTGAAIVWALALVHGERPPRDPFAWGWFAWLGATGAVLPFFLISWGTKYIDSGLAGILIGTVPITVVVLSHFVLPDEPMNRYKAAGFASGFAGVILLIGPGNLTNLSGSGITLIAEFALLAAAVSFAVQAVTARRMPPMGVMLRAASVLLVSALSSIVIALVVSPQGLAGASLPGLLAAAALGLFPTALGALALFRLLDRAGAGFVAMSNYLIPVWALLTGMLFLGEKLTWNMAAGFALILAGIAVSEHLGARARRRATARQAPGRSQTG